MESIWRAYKRSDSNIFEHLLKVRGMDKDKLDPDFSKHLYDPFLLPDMRKACEIIKSLKEGSLITVFGDYDADGTPASALLYEVLTMLKFEVQVLLPTRQEGYGLNNETLKKIDPKSVLLITVDTGITAVEQVSRIKIPVIIIDHHLPKSELPKADAIIDPYIPNSKYPFQHLCACALAYKFAVALSTFFPDRLNESKTKWLLDLVAISTVSDMVPIVDENRVLVHFGLIVLQKNRRVGIKALLETAGIDASNINEGVVGYAIGPRMNASGRLSDNMPAFNLLITKDQIEAYKLATQINKNNSQRQKLVTDLLVEADNVLFLQNAVSDKAYILVGENWPSGVLGLVAGRLSSKFNRPVIVGTKSNGVITASARSIDKFSIADALNNSSEFLERFGGHNLAAGLSLKEENQVKFVDSIKSRANELLKEGDLRKIYSSDAILENSEVNFNLLSDIQRIAPFGYQNSKPQFILKNQTLTNLRKMGNALTHCKWQINNGELDVLGFGFSNRKLPSGEAHLLGNLEKNEWNGSIKLQFNLVDILPASVDIEEIDVEK